MRKPYQICCQYFFVLPRLQAREWLDGSYVLETKVQGVKQSHKMTIESLVMNPKLDDSLSAVPKIQ